LTGFGGGGLLAGVTPEGKKWVRGAGGIAAVLVASSSRVKMQLNGT
jgi:hypothetical protein